MNIKYIKQKHPCGCVVASLAMITNQMYDDVLKDLFQYWKLEGESSGIGDDVIQQYLSERGYSFNIFSYNYTPSETLRTNWPLEPFAPIHMCTVLDEGQHAVVMDNGGNIYDPDDRTKKKLTDFLRVYEIMGIYKLEK